MKWSKLKKLLEDLLCESLRGRVSYHCTRYGPGVSSLQTRAWITLDKSQLVSFSTPKYFEQLWTLKHQIRDNNRCQDYPDPAQRECYYAATREAENMLASSDIFSRDDFYHAAEAYVGMSVGDALGSDNHIIRALAMLDRRLGKRRLMTIRLTEGESPLVRALFTLRCQSEGIACAVPEIR